MRFGWDEAKRRQNVAKHGVDFLRAASLFDGRSVVTWSTRRSDEERYATTGQIDGRFFTVIWTWRGDVIRLISARRARDAEQRTYRSVHGERD